MVISSYIILRISFTGNKMCLILDLLAGPHLRDLTLHYLGFQRVILKLFFPAFPFDPPENIGKYFQGDQKGTLGRKELKLCWDYQFWLNVHCFDFNYWLLVAFGLLCTHFVTCSLFCLSRVAVFLPNSLLMLL